MDINKVLIEYDNLFGVASLEDIQEYLSTKIDQAYQEKDNYASVTLLNEMIGLSREIGDKTKGIEACNNAMLLMKKLGLEDTVDYGITLLNVANAYRAFNLLDDSLYYFREVEGIFNRKLSPGDFNYASLYNNWSLLYQEMREFQNARLMLERALAIVDMNDKAVLERATTRSNLAATLLELCKETKNRSGINDPMCQAYYDMALGYANQSIEIYETDGGRDYHFSAALSVMGDLLYFSGDYDDALKTYERALKQHEASVGKNVGYNVIMSKLNKTKETLTNNCASGFNNTDAFENTTRVDAFTNMEELVGDDTESFTEGNFGGENSDTESFTEGNLADESFAGGNFAKESPEGVSFTEGNFGGESFDTESFTEGNLADESFAGEIYDSNVNADENDVASRILGMDSVVSAATDIEALKNIQAVPETKMATVDDLAALNMSTMQNSFKEKFNKNSYIFTNHLERCRAFYEEYGRSMIREKFAEYEDRIAVGLVGEGSECFGFDDDISKDHDYAVGFCMWLTDKDYASIGRSLQKEYSAIIEKYGKRYFDNHMSADSENNLKINDRHGVHSIREFYRDLLRTSDSVIERLCNRNEDDILTDLEWFSIDEDDIATVTNGAVFNDKLGVFSNARRNLLKYYPDRIWYAKLAKELHTFSQNGQYNYGRMMARRDNVTAVICVANAMDSAMKIFYLLNRKYAPYGKWRFKGLHRLNLSITSLNIFEEIATSKNQSKHWRDMYNPYEINKSDKILCLFEELAGIILATMQEMKLVKGTDTFLDVYCDRLMDLARGKNSSTAETKTAVEDNKSGDDIGMKNSRNLEEIMNKSLDELVAATVEEEWQQFDKVENEGGRADCQNNWNTFSIMRKSQYMAWPMELLANYYADLVEARENGWNLITEKYARMMESTAPEKYAKLKGRLPFRDKERLAIQEQIVGIQVEWMEKFAEKYPKMAGNARSIHTYEDNEFNTSYETYLRGELGTYSESTILLYGRFIVDLQRDNKNLAYMIMENTAKLYGYASLEEAESRLI